MVMEMPLVLGRATLAHSTTSPYLFYTEERGGKGTVLDGWMDIEHFAWAEL